MLDTTRLDVSTCCETTFLIRKARTAEPGHRTFESSVPAVTLGQLPYIVVIPKLGCMWCTADTARGPLLIAQYYTF
jgi:hypothetical protein